MNLRWLQADEYPLGQEIVSALWKQEHILARNAALFSWQYRNLDDPAQLGFLVAEDRERMVGCIGKLPIAFHIRGEPVPGVAVALFVVEPEHRQSALGLELLNRLYSDSAIVVTIGINDRVGKLYRMLQQHIIEPMPRYVCIGHRNCLEKLLSESSHPPGLSMDSFNNCSILHRNGNLPAGYCVERLQQSQLGEWNRTWIQRFAPHLQGTVRDARFIKWRYFDHPVFQYDILVVRGMDREIHGFATVRLIRFSDQTTALRVLDFLADERDTGLVLADAVAGLATADTAFAECIALGESWRALASVGFSAEGCDLFATYFNPPDFNYTGIKAAIRVVHDGMTAKSFAVAPETYITIADGDQDRPN